MENNQVICPVCSGKGTCDFCLGRGFMEKKPCPCCEGQGVETRKDFSTDAEFEFCNFCNGKGFVWV